jgi:hypothetical protein
MGHNGSNTTTKLKIFEMNDLDGQALLISKRCSLVNNNNQKKNGAPTSEAIRQPGNDRRSQRDRVYLPGADFPRNLMRTAVVIYSLIWLYTPSMLVKEVVLDNDTASKA